MKIRRIIGYIFGKNHETGEGVEVETIDNDLTVHYLKNGDVYCASVETENPLLNCTSTYDLTFVISEHGSVSVQEDDGDLQLLTPGNNIITFTQDATINMVVYPDSGYLFSGSWEGSDATDVVDDGLWMYAPEEYSPTNYHIIMNNDKNITINFIVDER